MTSYRPSSYIDDDPYAHPRRNRSPPPASLSRRDYDYPAKSRSPDYTRGSVGRGNSYYKNQSEQSLALATGCGSSATARVKRLC